MKNEIALTEGKNLAEVGQNVMDILDQQEEQDFYEPGFLQVKINHGSKSFEVGALGMVNSPLHAVILAVDHVRALWPMGDEGMRKTIKEWSGPAPLCSSKGNGGTLGELSKILDADAGKEIEALLVPPGEAMYHCKSCGWNEFGTADRGQGKACKEMRRLLLFLYEAGQVGVLSVPPSSLKPWRSYITSLPKKRFRAVLTVITAVPETAGELKWSVLDFTPRKEKGAILPVTPDVMAPLGAVVKYGGKDCTEIEAMLSEFSQLDLVEDDDYPANGNSEAPVAATESTGDDDKPF